MLSLRGLMMTFFTKTLNKNLGFMSAIFDNKKLLFFFLCLVISFIELKGQTLHFIIVTQSENTTNIGSQQDKITMQTLAQEIEQNVPGLTVKPIFIDGSQASKTRIQQELSGNISSNDVIWYYYSGHGINYDTWPMSEEGQVPLIWVHNMLKTTPARMTIAMYDCRNYEDPLGVALSNLQPRSSYYKFLFLEAKGNIIVASCSSTQFSYGTPDEGGFYTNNFIDALRSESNWENILKIAKQSTVASARERGKNQIPVYDIQIDSALPISAPSVPTKRYNSLSAIAQAMTRACQANGNQMAKVSISDIQRWNPGVTSDNFKSFKRLKFNPNDLLLYGSNEDYPVFTYPCPTPSCVGELSLELLLPNLINQEFIKLEDVHDSLKRILEASGYYDKRYFRTEDNKGFVLATKLERIDKEDASPKKKRFQQGRNKLTFDNFSFKEYLNQLLFSKKGHYRIFVFVVSKDLYLEETKEDDAERLQNEIYTKGNPNLFYAISKEVILFDEYHCNVLVYEMEEDEQTGLSTVVKISKFQAQDHIKASGIHAALQQLKN